MEADGSSSSTCGYCQQTGHRTEECREQSNDRRIEATLGCFVALLLAPFAMLGYVLGVIGGAVWAGILRGFGYWSSWAKSSRVFRADRP